jgi:hypothetical protein
VALWPLGGGYEGNYRRDGMTLRYHSVSVPDDLDPEQILASSMAPIALLSRNPPADAVDRVVDAIAAATDPDARLVLVELAEPGPEAIAIQLIEALARRGMSDILEQTSVGRDIARRNREEAQREAQIEDMSVALEHSYGPIPDLRDLAHKLSTTNHRQHFAWVMDRVPLEQLRSA